MKKVIFVLALFVGLQMNAQSSVTNMDRILELYGSYWEELSQHDPEREKIMMDLLENRVEIKKEKPFKGEKYLKLSEVPLFDKYNKDLKRDKEFNPDTFNILKYKINFFTDKYEVFRVDNTDYIVIVKPKNFENYEK